MVADRPTETNLGKSAARGDPPRSPGDDAPTRWLALEQIFAANRYEGSLDDVDSLRDSIGTAWSAPAPGLIEVTGSLRPNVVVTATHATNHVRAGTTKLADRGTGGLALLLAELTGCTALIAVSSLADTPGDANYDAAHPFKERLADLSPDVVVDLHGMRTREDLDIDLGTGSGAVPAAVIEALRGTDLHVTENEVFDATRRTTVTAFAQQLGIAAVQLEIGAHLRPPTGTSESLAQLVSALAGALETAANSAKRLVSLAPVPVPVVDRLPTAVLPPGLLPDTTGPVPVLVSGADEPIVAWAWRTDAPGLPEPARAIGPDQIGVTTRLAERLSAGPVTVDVPAMTAFTDVAARADDMPGAGEVQVNAQDFPDGPERLLAVRGGTTAWVTATPRDHVRRGTIRTGYQLRLMTQPGDQPEVPFVLVRASAAILADPARRSVGWWRRATGAVDRAGEQLLRAVFRAPESSARVIQAHAGDDDTPTVVVHPAVLDRIHVRSGQQVLVGWGGAEAVAIAVVDHEAPPDGAPSKAVAAVQRVGRLYPALPTQMNPLVVLRASAALRHRLAAPPHTVFTIRRRVRPELVQHLNALVLPITGLVVSFAALDDAHWPTVWALSALSAVFGLARLRVPSIRPSVHVNQDWLKEMPGPGSSQGKMEE